MGAELSRQPGLRAHQPRGNHQSALRVMDGSARLPATHRCFIGSADPPGPYPRSQWRKLSAEGLNAAAETAANREEIVGEIDTRTDAG